VFVFTTLDRNLGPSVVLEMYRGRLCNDNFRDWLATIAMAG
jgi:hypothetical protein